MGNKTRPYFTKYEVSTLLDRAPEALTQRIACGELSEKDAINKTREFITLLEHGRSKGSPVWGKIQKLLMPPISFNPNAVVQEWPKSSSLAGNSLMGKMLDASCPEHLITMMCEAGFDFRHFPDAPFILSALKYQSLKALDVLAQYGANLHVACPKNGNGFYYVINNNLPIKEKTAQIDWLLAHDVDGFNAMRINFYAPDRKQSVFEYAIHKTSRHHNLIVGMLARGMGKIDHRDVTSDKGIWFAALDGRWLQSARDNGTVKNYYKENSARCDSYLNAEKPIESITSQEITRFFSINRLDELQPALQTLDDEKLLTLYDAQPASVKAEMTYCPRPLSAHIGRTIQGPAQNWGIIQPLSRTREGG